MILRLDSRTMPQTAIRGRLIGRLKAVSILSASESQFAKIIQELELDPLFQRLFLPGAKLPRVITRSPWPKTNLHQNFYELKDPSAPQATDRPTESILEGHQKLIPLIHKMGQEAFERYFLYGTDICSWEDIAKETGLTLDEVKKIHNLILEVSLQSSLSSPWSTLTTAGRRYTLVAQIHPDTSLEKRYSLSLTLPHLARGRYRVNQEALAQWLHDKVLNREEKKRLKKILESIEFANIRQNTLMRILEAISEKQSSYIASGEKTKRRPLTMRSLSKELGVAPSTISRLVALRSIRLPKTGEAKLSDLLPNQREVLTSVLEELLTRPENKNLSDQALTQKIQSEFHITVSRRTTNECRRHLLNNAQT